MRFKPVNRPGMLVNLRRGNVVRVDDGPPHIVVKRSGGHVWIKPLTGPIQPRRSTSRHDHEGQRRIDIRNISHVAVR